jgi:hypothetical protein
MKSNKDQLREEYSEELIKSGVRGKHIKRFVSTLSSTKRPFKVTRT